MERMIRKRDLKKTHGKGKGTDRSAGDYLNFGRKANIRTIGSSQAIPPYRFTKEIHRFRMQASASAFKTKTNLTGSQIKGAGAAYGFALGWSVGDLPFSFATLFDQYRLTRIICRITSSKNTNTTGLGSLLYVVEDYDNSTLLTSAAGAQTYENCQVVRGSDAGAGESIVIDLAPKVPVPSVLGSLVLESPWQDMAVATNTHYGIKGWYATGAATDPVWDVDAQYWVEVRNQQ
jgi:hypothetical protein